MSISHGGGRPGGPRDFSRGPGGSQGRGAPVTPSAPPVFDPAKNHAELVDELAEAQADLIQRINSSQLRRFFGEAKDLYRRLETSGNNAPQQDEIYKKAIEPQFRMMRSKASYAWRNGEGGKSKIPGSFHSFIENGVRKVKTAGDFIKFIQHFEAVVGFIYGKGYAEERSR